MKHVKLEIGNPNIRIIILGLKIGIKVSIGIALKAIVIASNA